MTTDDLAARLVDAHRALPPSTVARGLLVAAMRPKQNIAQALERIENDVQTLRAAMADLRKSDQQVL